MVERSVDTINVTLTTGATAQKIVESSRLVKYAVIQNRSTENVTISTYANLTGGTGIILNAAGAAGQAGGSMEVLPNNPSDDRVDLSKFYFVRTTAGATLSIYLEE